MFSHNLRNRMSELNISQAELSRRANIPRSSVCGYLAGKTLPRKDVLDAVAAALDTTPEMLTEGEKKITVKMAAELMGVSEQFIRTALQQGKLPIGTAVKLTGNRYTYYISPKKFTEYTGIKI